MTNVLTVRAVVPVAFALALGGAAVAQAKVIDGTPGNDVIRGSRQADVINALAGNDRVFSLRGADTVNGQEGDDVLVGGRGNDTLNGLAGADRVRGGRGDDTLVGDVNNVGDLTSPDRIWGSYGADKLYGGDSPDQMWGGPGPDQSWGQNGDDLMGGGRGADQQWGGPGNDTIFAAQGRDVSYGEDGDDNLWALARRDVHGPNDLAGDTLNGGAGNDTFHTRDGERDVVDCGPGVDTALIDFKDVIADATPQNPNGSCEVVNRHARRPGEDRVETTTPPEEG
jgi:Ca2+-binding RTX toxin-like protein